MTEHAAVIFVFFFLAEYASILLICILTSILFLGGYLINFVSLIYFIKEIDFYLYISIISYDYEIFLSNPLIEGLVYGLTLGLKVCVMIFIFIWSRASFPRIRFDQLMSFCWTILLPIVIAFIILVPCVLYSFEIIPANVSLLSLPFIINKKVLKSKDTIYKKEGDTKVSLSGHRVDVAPSTLTLGKPLNKYCGFMRYVDMSLQPGKSKFNSLVSTDYILSKDKEINLYLDAFEFSSINSVYSSFNTLKNAITRVPKGSVYTVYVKVRYNINSSFMVGNGILLDYKTDSDINYLSYNVSDRLPIYLEKYELGYEDIEYVRISFKKMDTK